MTTTARNLIKGDSVTITINSVDYTADFSAATITSAENKDGSTFFAPYYEYTLKLTGIQSEDAGSFYEMLWATANRGTVVPFTVKTSSSGDTVSGQVRIPFNNPDWGGDQRAVWKQTFSLEVVGTPTLTAGV